MFNVQVQSELVYIKNKKISDNLNFGFTGNLTHPNVRKKEPKISFLGRYELIIRFSSETVARKRADGRFIFYILYIIYKQKIAKFGAAKNIIHF